ncbi:cation:proton antiporter domain-containing protein [Catalinimonas niigatensis]|uniref:cation:proton antiporter domain-containing protein n=1 Tax=Catalinimonas niigatensis TaxID=1397264 RepID=UPI0026658C96|nr:cation:proton antiporter [Catalinimonas niigatensis]WPP51219.1 cation:proton antiporter [Catalinimonas niigatensis]
MEFHHVLLAVSLLIVVSGLLILKIKSMRLTEPIIAMLFGLILGPYLLDFLDMHNLENPERFMELASMLTISMALMATAYRIRDDYLRSYGSTQSVILLLVMPLMWLFSGLIAYLILDISLGLAFLIGAIITPTDPVVASSIVSGKLAQKFLPARIRDTLSFESGANDGLAFPLVLLMLFILGEADTDNILVWVMKVVGWDTLGAMLTGIFLGYIFGKLMHQAHSRQFMNTQSLLSFSIAFGFLVLSLVETLQANGIIAVFAAGYMLKQEISGNEELEEEKIQEMMERIFTIPVFFFFGLFLPIDEWLALGWKIVFFGLFILLFRRLPAFVLLKPLLTKWNHWYDILLMGWFGSSWGSGNFLCHAYIEGNALSAGLGRG